MMLVKKFEEIGEKPDWLGLSEDALDQLEKFSSINGPVFYGLSSNDATMTLERKAFDVPSAVKVNGLDETLRPFLAGESLSWSLIDR